MTTLPSTRDLDMEVAEKVLDWKRGVRYGNGNGEWLIGDDKPGTRRTWNLTPRFSTDMSAAWLVVEAMRERYGATVLIESMPDGWAVRFSGFIVKGDGRSPSAALAICRAALAALKVANATA